MSGSACEDAGMKVLSIQSSVAYGHVGNSAAGFPLQRLGVEVWPVFTVHFSNHTGYGAWRGPLLSADDVREVITGIEERGVLGEVDAVLSPDQQQQVSTVLEEDAEIMSNTGLEELLADETPEVQAEVIRINTDSRIIALQVALLVPILAGLIGVLNAFRMRRLPDPKASASTEGSMLG